ncbi:MAG: hypothetical protein HRT94_03565 [Alphaproteobacteria bacterium]|nr:hypothetical protein [Alphaproteobacteria bacterium]
MQDKDLDKLLQERFTPPPSTNLAERIIDAVPSNKVTKGRSFTDILDLFFMPKPALAFACVALLSVVFISAQQTDVVVPDSNDAVAQESFAFVVEDEVFYDIFGSEEWI